MEEGLKLIRIAIVDDEEKSLEYNKSLVKKIFSSMKLQVDIVTYEKPQNLIYDIDEKMYFDICLLDIEMPGMNGLNLAEQINEKLYKCYILFITSHTEYAMVGYELKAFRFIKKSRLKEKLPVAIRKIYEELNDKDEKSYIIKTNYRHEKIYYKEVIYIRKEKKYSIFVTLTGESAVRKGISEVYRELESDEFIIIDRGCIVNIKYIKKVNSNELIMVNDNRLSISRSNFQDVKRIINQYWRINV